MGYYTMAIENNDACIKASPKFVWVDMFYVWDPFSNFCTWDISIRNINNWIGVSGVSDGVLIYKSKTLYFTRKSDNGKYLMRWFNIDFPNDSISKVGEDWKHGGGEYFSKYTGQWHTLEWSNRNIIPEP